MAYQCVLFDLDNTLLLKKPTLTESIFALTARYRPDLGLETIEQAYAASELWQGQQIQKENESGQRMPDEEYLANVLAVYQGFLSLDEKATEELVALLSQRHSKNYVLAPGALQVLDHCKEKGLALGVVSNNHTGIRQTLLDLGIASYFKCILISEEVNLFKPDPQILTLACDTLGVHCKDSIYIGDHPFDILCAHAADLHVAWIPPNRFFTLPDYITAPEYTLHTLTDLITTLL